MNWKVVLNIKEYNLFKIRRDDDISCDMFVLDNSNILIIKRVLIIFSRFNIDEMKRIYRGFKTECPTGLITEETFHDIYSRFFPHGGKATQSH